MRRTWFESGKWNALCDVCGKKYKNTELQKRWDGLMTCEQDWEPRHPQELIRPIPDQTKLPWTRPEPRDQFITTPITPNLGTCTPLGMLCQASYGSADCMIVGNVDGALIP